jgi:hypothetical protein
MSLQINDVSYAGKFASQYWTPAFYGMDTLKKGVVNVIDNIKKKINIGNIDFAGGLQPRQATPSTPLGTWTVDKKYLEPKDAMLYSIFNPRDLEAHWESENLSELLLERQLPANFESYVIYTMMSRTFEKMEAGWWMSSTAYQAITDTTDPRYYLQFFDGYLKQLVSDATVLAVPTPTTITNSTIGSVLDSLISEVTTYKKALITNTSKYQRMKFIMSPLTELLYNEYLTTGTVYKGTDYSAVGTPRWKGYEVVSLAGFPDNTVIFCEALPNFDGAFHIGLNSASDENTLQLARTRAMDETFFVKALMKMDVQYKYGNEIGLYTTLTAADFNL